MKKRGDWWRFIPHPGYGRWGGRLRTDPDFDDDYSPEPVDKMDAAFMDHDLNLRSTTAIEDPHERALARKEADKILGAALREPLRPFLHPNRILGAVYGPAYLAAAKLVFRP